MDLTLSSKPTTHPQKKQERPGEREGPSPEVRDAVINKAWRGKARRSKQRFSEDTVAGKEREASTSTGNLLHLA